MVDTKISHNWYGWWLILCEEVFQSSVGVLVGANEGCLFGADLQANAGELVVEVPVGLYCLLGHLVGTGSCCVKANVIHPTQQVDVLVLLVPWGQCGCQHCLCKQWCLGKGVISCSATMAFGPCTPAWPFPT